MAEFTKLEPGNEMYLRDFPQACVCGSQKGPIVATGLTYRVGTGPEAFGHVYLCRLCVKRAALSLGMVKGEEMEKLQGAADELAQAAREVAERQTMIDRLTVSAGEREAKLNTQREYIETLQAELQQQKHYANTIAATAKEMVAA